MSLLMAFLKHSERASIIVPILQVNTLRFKEHKYFYKVTYLRWQRQNVDQMLDYMPLLSYFAQRLMMRGTWHSYFVNSELSSERDPEQDGQTDIYFTKDDFPSKIFASRYK